MASAKPITKAPGCKGKPVACGCAILNQIGLRGLIGKREQLLKI